MDELERLRGVVLESLDREQDARGLARDAYRSRTQFYRVFRALVEETPVAMRRRLLLERAAWQLSRTPLSVTDISLDANYGSLEAFTRAFRKSFGVSPSMYRRLGATHTQLHAANGIHHYSEGSAAPAPIDLFDIFAGEESADLHRLLEAAANLSDEQLDAPLESGPDPTLRHMLDRMVQTKELWSATMTGAGAPLLDEAPPEQRTPAAMLARVSRADAALHSVLGDVRNRSAWDDTFVDAACDPPQTFSFGAMFAHVTIFNAQRRILATDIMRRVGQALSPTHQSRA